MRADTAGAKTWLLGAIASWALCTWLLALFGLGGHIDRLPEDPALLQALPQARKPPPERLGPLPQYAEIGRRPLFSETRRAQPFFINPDGQDDGKGGFDFVLTSVLIAPDFRMAILQPSAGGESVRVKVGAAPESAQGWTLSSVDPRNAVFNGPDGERKLELRVFNGEGGEPPTAMAVGGQNATQLGPGGSAPQPPPPGGTNAPRPPQSTPDTDSAVNAVPPTSKPPAKEDAVDNQASAEQIDAIRKRIEARRAKLRQEQPPPSPGKKP
jgi:general secretion pathway protein N